MLISCFQCRQQLDVPEDSAGKRVRCPHCQYVIVVPAKSQPSAADEVHVPAMALPSMELDGDGDKPAATKVSPMPLPPLEAPPPPREKKPVAVPIPPSTDDYPELPSIDRGSSRRGRMSATPPSNIKWGRIIGIGAVIGVIVIGIIAGIASSSRNNRRHQFVQPPHNPPMQVQPPMQMFPPPGMPQEFPAGIWHDFTSPDRRFKVRFPGGQPQNFPRNLNRSGQMTAYQLNIQGNFTNREYSVLHRVIADADFGKMPLENRYSGVQQDIREQYGVNDMRSVHLMLAGVHQGRQFEFTFFNQNNQWLWVRTYFVKEGARHHHFILIARGPFGVENDRNLFLDSFALLPLESQSILDEVDNLNAGARRDNEFNAFAVHPKKQVIAVGGVNGQLKITGEQANIQPAPFSFVVRDGKPIEQLSVSPEGRWLATAVDGNIEYWENWADGMPQKRTNIPGVRCTFLDENRMLIATKNAVEEHTIEPPKLVHSLPIDDIDIKGFSVAPDRDTLAVYGGQWIKFYHWREKKLLGSIDAHRAAVTAVTFSPDGKTLASASIDRTINLWNVDTRDLRSTLKHHAWTVWSLAFKPDGKYLASGGCDGMLLLWDVQPQQPQLLWAQSTQYPVRNVAFASSGQFLYATSKYQEPFNPNLGGARQFTRQVRKIPWNDIKQNGPEAQRLLAQKAGLYLPATAVWSYLSPDGQTYVSTTDSIDNFAQNYLRVWDTATARLRASHPMKNNGVLSPDGKWFLYAKSGGFNHLQLLDVPANKVYESVLSYTGQNFPRILFADDGMSFWMERNHEFVRHEIQAAPGANPKIVQKRVVLLKNANDFQTTFFIHASSDSKTFMVERMQVNGLEKKRTVYNSATGEVVPTPKPAPAGPSNFVRVNKNVNQLAVEDFLHGRLEVFGLQRPGMGLSALDAQRKLAATTQFGNDNLIRVNLWDVPGQKPLLTIADQQARTANALRLSPDGKLLTLVSNEYGTRITPVEWLLERKVQLPVQPFDVAAP